MKYLMRVVYALLGAGAVVANLALSGAIIASVQLLGPWAYPVHFGFGMFAASLVLAVLLPPKRRGMIAAKLGEKFVLSEGRFSKGIWPKVRERGSFALVLTANILVGPFFAALVIRFLGLTEQKSWLYAFTTTLIGSAIWVSLYLGVFAAIRAYLVTMFAAL